MFLMQTDDLTAVVMCDSYVNPRHSADPQLKRLTGWWGNDPATRFKMAQS